MGHFLAWHFPENLILISCCHSQPRLPEPGNDLLVIWRLLEGVEKHVKICGLRFFGPNKISQNF